MMWRKLYQKSKKSKTSSTKEIMDEYTVRVRFDEDDYMYIEFQLDDGIIEIDENGWYVA